MHYSRLVAIVFLSGAICGPIKYPRAVSVGDTDADDAIAYPDYRRGVQSSKRAEGEEETVAYPDYRRGVQSSKRAEGEEATVAYPDYRRDIEQSGEDDRVAYPDYRRQIVPEKGEGEGEGDGTVGYPH